MKNKYILEYIDYLTYQKKYSINTTKLYHENILEFYEYIDCNNNKLLNISYDDIKKYLEFLDNKKLSSASISNKISSLRSFYKYLVRKGYAKLNAFSLISSPKKSQKLPKFMYSDELNQIFEQNDLDTPLGIRNRLIFELLYATGMRVSELTHIEIKNIDMKEHTIKVFGKGSKERITYFGEYALEYLEKYLKESRPRLMKKSHDYLLVNNRGERISERGITLIIDNTIKKTAINKKISPHIFRHTFATDMLNAGCDILTVKELLGHESLKATQIYTHVTNEHLKEVYFKSLPRSKKKD